MTRLFLSLAAQGGLGNGIAAIRYTLSNGVVVLIQRNTSSPTVSVRGEIGVGAVHEPAEKSGLSAFTGASLIRGTQKRTFQQIVSETEERGCSVNAGGGLHSSGFGARALAEDLPLVLEILAEMVIRPTFPDHEVEKLRGQFLMSLRESEQEPHTQASRAVRSLLYPSVHPYSRLSSGTMETVQGITRIDLETFHRNYHPTATVIAVVGDVDPETVITMLEQFFGSWEPAGTVPEATLPDVPPLEGIQRRDIIMAGKVQSDIIWNVHGLKRSNPDYYAAMIGNMVLGRLGMGGRLGENVRENQGMAYYVYSGLEADRGAGPWSAVAGVNPTNIDRALEAILHEVERFKQEGPTEQELADVCSYLTGSLVLGLETNAGIAGTLLAIERHSLGMDYVARYPGIIRSVTHDQIVSVARKYLSTEHYALAVAGPGRG